MMSTIFHEPGWLFSSILILTLEIVMLLASGNISTALSATGMHTSIAMSAIGVHTYIALSASGMHTSTAKFVIAEYISRHSVSDNFHVSYRCLYSLHSNCSFHSNCDYLHSNDSGLLPNHPIPSVCVYVCVCHRSDDGRRNSRHRHHHRTNPNSIHHRHNSRLGKRVKDNRLKIL